jgi:hypothetical protein
MLAARNVDLDAPNAPRRTPVPENALLVVLSALALLNPARLMRRGSSCNGIRMGVIGTSVLVVIAAIGGPIVRSLNVSAATALVAAGAAAVVTSLVAFALQLRSRADSLSSSLEFLLFGILRPETLMLAIAVGSGGQGWTWSVTIALAIAVAMAVPSSWSTRNSVLVSWLTYVFMVLAVVCGIALIVDGVYAV